MWGSLRLAPIIRKYYESVFRTTWYRMMLSVNHMTFSQSDSPKLVTCLTIKQLNAHFCLSTEDKLRLTRNPEQTQKATGWGMRVPHTRIPMPSLSVFARECVLTKAYPPLHHLQGLQINWEAPWHSEMLTELVRKLRCFVQNSN